MSIPITCPGCQARMKAPDTVAGRKIKCPKCGGVVGVPGSAQVRDAAPQAAPKVEKGAVSRSTKPAPPGRAEQPRTKPASAAVTPRPRETPPTKPKRPAKADGYDDLEIVRSAEDALAQTWESSDLGQRENLLVTSGPLFSLNSLVYRDFRILDPQTKQVVGIASDNPGMLVQCLRFLNFGRFSLRAILPTNLEVREAENSPLLFRIRRAPQLVKFFVTVEIYDGQGHMLGYFKNKLFSLFGGFWVYDADDNKVAQLKFNWGMPPKMVFETASGDSLGSVYPEGARKAIEQKKVSTVVTLGRAPGLDLKVSDKLKEDPTARLLLLAAVLALQFSGIGGSFRMKV
jgi:hypothetical protein